jgi:hypothetical protein
LPIEDRGISGSGENGKRTATASRVAGRTSVRYWVERPTLRSVHRFFNHEAANIVVTFVMLRYEMHTMGKTLLQKVWDLHKVRTLPTGPTQLSSAST